MSPKKVLLSGSVDGKISSLFKRVSAVNKSNGPFDMLLCSGRFFPEAGETYQALNMQYGWPQMAASVCVLLGLPLTCAAVTSSSP